ncbi:kinase-like domain-containing protein [Mycena alexandri]|uniref:Kinase-like domain-containing protein n=1 Tax=Mycena alexandri TaxID=1745969 RepID=A0AAD6SL26_9AGAR|nr:kinase-like domain-containing protein [Mycena alexandri]
MPDPGTFTFTEQLEQGIVGPVFAGTLRPLKGAGARFLSSPVPVVAKVALHPAETHLLLQEAAIYARLSHLQGSAIPRIFGVFAGRAFAVLVMAHVGGQVDQIGTLNREQRASLYSGLERLHAGGVLHGDLRAENVVVSATGVPSLIDLSHARVHQCKGAAVCEELREGKALFGLVGGL